MMTLSQIDEEVAKLLELKAQIKDDGPQKFQLKVPKVIDSFAIEDEFFQY